MSLLSLRHVSKFYPDGPGTVAALKDVSMEVDEGDFVGLRGMRQSGKTTLLRVAAVAELPDEGSVCFDGHDVASMSADARAKLQRRNGIGLVSTDWRPGRNKPAIEHVALPLLSDGLSLREAKEPAHLALDRMGVSRCAYTPTNRLSRVERVRVGLARAFVHKPRLLLVDDPAVLLSPSEGVELYELLASLGGDPQLAIVVASEELQPIRRASRHMSIDQGKLRSMDQSGTVVPFPDQRTSGRARSSP
jgi:predicted ABC-type transport system involved in lysophospholipase L1 biosynthesis ATPase subunit